MSESSSKGWVVPVVVGVVSFGGGLALGYFAGKQQKAVDEYFVDEPETVNETWMNLGLEDNIPKPDYSIEEREQKAWESVEDVAEKTSDVVIVSETQQTTLGIIEEGMKKKAYEAIAEYRGESISVDPMDPDKGRPNPADITVAGDEDMDELLDEEEGVVYVKGGQKIPIKDIIEHQFSDPNWDWDEEEAFREANPDAPHVIHMDEFFTNESEFVQSELYYYELDDVLVDEDKTPIYDYADVIGPFKWGHGSDDENIYYVRNNKTKVEFSILRHENDSYLQSVLGIEEEEETDEEPRRKKLRSHKDE